MRLPWERWLAHMYEQNPTKQRIAREFLYRAGSWKVGRCVIARLEYGTQGTNLRFVVTSLKGAAAELYDGLYCQRGEAKNGSRKPNWICSTPARVAGSSSPTGCA